MLEPWGTTVLFSRSASPPPSSATAARGPQSRGTTGRESQRAQPGMAPRVSFSFWGTGLAHQFLWPHHPQTCSAGSYVPGSSGRAAQSCAPQPVKIFTGALESFHAATHSMKPVLPRVLVSDACILLSTSPITIISSSQVSPPCVLPLTLCHPVHYPFMTLMCHLIERVSRTWDMVPPAYPNPLLGWCAV